MVGVDSPLGQVDGRRKHRLAQADVALLRLRIARNLDS